MQVQDVTMPSLQQFEEAIQRKVLLSVLSANGEASSSKASKSQMDKMRKEGFEEGVAKGKNEGFAAGEQAARVKHAKKMGVAREIIESQTKKALLAAHPDKLGPVGLEVTQALNAIREEVRKLPTNNP